MGNTSLVVARTLDARLPFYYGWVVVFAAGTTVFARSAPSVSTLALFLSPMAEEFGWSRTLISGAVSVGAVSSILLSPLVGRAVDRFGSRLILTVSMLVLGVAVVSLAWATVPVFFYLGFATGRVIFHVPVQIASGALISRWFIRKRGRAIGAIYLTGAVGGIVAVQIASLLISHWSIGGAWIALGVMVLAVSFLPSMLLIVDRPEDMGLEPDGVPLPGAAVPLGEVSVGLGESPRRVEEEWTVREAMKTNTLWVLTGVVGVLFMIQAGVSVHLGAFYQDRGLSLTAVAMAITIHGVVNAFGSMLWGTVIERVSVRKALTALMVLGGVTVLALLAVNSLFIAFAVSAVIGVVASGGNVIPPVAFAAYFGRRSIGSIRGISETGVQVGQTIGPVLSGLAYDLNGSYVVAFVTFAVLASLGALVASICKPPVRRLA